MAAIHGKNGRLYVDVAVAADGSPVEIPFMADYSVEGSRDRAETTSFGDTTKTFTAGLADASGSINGFYNDASNDIYQVGDGSARDFYIYIDGTDATSMGTIAGGGKGYWYGSATFDTSSTVGVTDVAKVTLNWAAATSVVKV